MARPLPRSDGDIPLQHSVRTDAGGVAWVIRVSVVGNVDALEVPWWLIELMHVEGPDELTVSPSRWRKGLWAVARQLLDAVPVGDKAVERGLQMNTAVWAVRATTEAERTSIILPDERLYPVQLLGGPIRELWHLGLNGSQSALPCNTPRRTLINGQAARIDCGTCGPCMARRAVEQVSADDWTSRRRTT